MSNRDLFAELRSALIECKEDSEGKITLKVNNVNNISDLDISPDEIVDIREQFNMSRGVFACLLHTSSRTLENWEQGRSAPNGQAITLLRLVQRHPETLSHISEL
ncbi:helix-turn-helix domain-containing protein [Vibrio echinoideorum]|uniref:helix-turn-helix domain-containing protein n=1 Tax=Vibrio echinoideorum TaxID=2100116 RepID=UPI00354D834C